MLEEQSLKPDLINVCYDDSISLENGGKTIRIKTQNGAAGKYLCSFLGTKRNVAKRDGRKEEDDYKIEQARDSENSLVNISGDLATALYDLNDLSYISDKKERQLRSLLADISIVSRKGMVAKMQFHKKPFHTPSSTTSYTNSKTRPAMRAGTTVGNGLPK